MKNFYKIIAGMLTLILVNSCDNVDSINSKPVGLKYDDTTKSAGYATVISGSNHRVYTYANEDGVLQICVEPPPYSNTERFLDLSLSIEEAADLDFRTARTLNQGELVELIKTLYFYACQDYINKAISQASYEQRVNGLEVTATRVLTILAGGITTDEIDE